MNSKLRASRIGTLKPQFKKRVAGLLFVALTEEQRAVAIIRMESHCFSITDQSRFTFEFEKNKLVKMIDHNVLLENMLN